MITLFSVLIVEDDKELSELYCTVLSDNGYKVYTAQNGEIALKIIHESYIYLMICDVMMTKMDGYELTKQLRESGFISCFFNNDRNYNIYFCL